MLLALIEIAMGPGKLTFDADQYDVMVIAGCSQQTVSRSIRRLIERHGILQLVEAGLGTKAATYRFTRYEVSHTVLPLHGAEWHSPSNGSASHDAFRSLGRRTGQAYELLGTEPITKAQHAALVGLTPAADSVHFRRLRAFDLAHYVAHDGWILGDSSLDDVAREVGVLGRRDTEREGVRIRRRQRAQYLANREQVSDKDVQTDTGEVVEMTDRQASDETARRLMAWVNLRMRFSREYLEQIADRHGEAAFYDLAHDIEGVPA